MRLLMAGHSLMGIKRSPSPYRLAKQNWLPKFAATETAGATVTSSMTPAQTQAAKPQDERGGNSAPTLASKLTNQPTTKAVTHDKQPGRLQVLPVRVSARTMQRLKQAELKLDQVQVMRNDLSGSDVEFVVKKKEPALLAELTLNTNTTAPNTVKPEPQGWAARWFKTGRMGA